VNDRGTRGATERALAKLRLRDGKLQTERERHVNAVSEIDRERQRLRPAMESLEELLRSAPAPPERAEAGKSVAAEDGQRLSGQILACLVGHGGKFLTAGQVAAEIGHDSTQQVAMQLARLAGGANGVERVGQQYRALRGAARQAAG